MIVDLLAENSQAQLWKTDDPLFPYKLCLPVVCAWIGADGRDYPDIELYRDHGFYQHWLGWAKTIIKIDQKNN